MRTSSARAATILAVCFLAASCPAARGAEDDSSGKTERIRIKPDESASRVDVEIDGRPFTAYLWPEKLPKPVLYPLRTAHGTAVTRGYPLEPRPGERMDHPHHIGMWFNYGNVSGIDFWNNSDAIPAADKPKMGVIRQRAILAAKSGGRQGELRVAADWMKAGQQVMIKEDTRLVFRGGADYRSIDRITTLQAEGDPVIFHDDKEGLLGIRVARALESPLDKPEVLTDGSGRAAKMPVMDNAGVNGIYLTSEGKKGDAAWGTRGRWCVLSGQVGGEPVTVAILDHPANPGFPTFWHARGYGLFAANPLGPSIFTNGKQRLELTLQPRESVIFRYRVLILSQIASPETIEAAYREFTAEYR